MVETLTPGDANIFPEYVLPGLKRYSKDAEGFVRATYAQCIAGIGKC